METLLVLALIIWGIIETYNHLSLRNEIKRRCYSHLANCPPETREAQRRLIDRMGEMESLVFLEQMTRAEAIVSSHGGLR